MPSFAPSTVLVLWMKGSKTHKPLHSCSLQSRIWQGNKPNKPTNIIIYAFIYIYIHAYIYTHIHTYILVRDYKVCCDKGREQRGNDKEDRGPI